MTLCYFTIDRWITPRRWKFIVEGVKEADAEVMVKKI